MKMLSKFFANIKKCSVSFNFAFLVILFDQITKYLVIKQFYFGESYTVLNGVLSFYKAYNTGAAFSILQEKTAILLIITVIALIFIIYLLLQKCNKLSFLQFIAWGCILGGAVGNMIDRVRFGYVIDFVKLDFINFPIFNISDIAINIGALIIFMYILKSSFTPDADSKS